MPTSLYNTTKLNQLTVSDFVYGVPNLVFYFKCYNLPFFGWRYGKFGTHVQIDTLTLKKLTHPRGV